MAEIIRRIEAPDPAINPWEDRYRRFTFLSDRSRRNLLHEISNPQVAPETHPLVVDLCAGDGSATKILVEAGWKPANITCVDRYRSPDPLVDNCQWRYLDLRELSEALRIKEPLPTEILPLRHVFDMVVMVGAVGVFDSGNLYQQADLICDFFAKSGGRIICW